MLTNLPQIFPFFSPDLVDDIQKEGQLKSIEAGEVLMRTGQYIKNTVLIVEGLIKVYREDEEGNEFLIYYLQRGQACAVSMIGGVTNEKSQISARAEENSTIITLPLPVLGTWMAKHKTWYEFVINSYQIRFNEVLHVLDSVAFQAMDARLVYYLKREAQKKGTQQLTISHQQIANDLNSSREVISRLLKKMEQKNMLKLNRNQIQIINLSS